MSALMNILRLVVGLVVEDGLLALAVLGVISLAALTVFLMPNLSLIAGAILLFGCLGVLLANILRAAQHKRVQ